MAGLRVGHLLDATFGDAAEGSEGDGKLIGGKRERLAMEIAAADHFVRVGKDERIVGSAVDLDGERGANVRKRIAHSTVNLRRTAQAVRILHARIDQSGAV